MNIREQTKKVIFIFHVFYKNKNISTPHVLDILTILLRKIQN